MRVAGWRRTGTKLDHYREIDESKLWLISADATLTGDGGGERLVIKSLGDENAEFS